MIPDLHSVVLLDTLKAERSQVDPGSLNLKKRYGFRFHCIKCPVRRSCCFDASSEALQRLGDRGRGPFTDSDLGNELPSNL